jgi:hypothetical protein
VVPEVKVIYIAFDGLVSAVHSGAFSSTGNDSRSPQCSSPIRIAVPAKDLASVLCLGENSAISRDRDEHKPRLYYIGLEGLRKK